MNAEEFYKKFKYCTYTPHAYTSVRCEIIMLVNKDHIKLRMLDAFSVHCPVGYEFDKFMPSATIIGAPFTSIDNICKSQQDSFPHQCPTCDSPAYIGFDSVECSKGCQ